MSVLVPDTLARPSSVKKGAIASIADDWEVIAEAEEPTLSAEERICLKRHENSLLQEPVFQKKSHIPPGA